MLNKLQPNSDLVTIILTTLNSEHYLTVSLESCLHQSYQNIEILVVDGGSTDKTLDIVRGFSDERIRIIHQSNNEVSYRERSIWDYKNLMVNSLPGLKMIAGMNRT